MTAADFNKIGIQLFGKFRWISKLAQEIGVDRSSVYRWSNGQIEVPLHIHKHVLLLAEQRRKHRRSTRRSMTTR